jgi:hypothetical protein
MMALRERGLAATSAWLGLMRSSATSFMAWAAQTARGGRNTSRNAGDELLDDAVFQRMEADHHQPAAGLQHMKAGLLAPVAALQARR